MLFILTFHLHFLTSQPPSTCIMGSTPRVNMPPFYPQRNLPIPPSNSNNSLPEAHTASTPWSARAPHAVQANPPSSNWSKLPPFEARSDPTVPSSRPSLGLNTPESNPGPSTLPLNPPPPNQPPPHQAPPHQAPPNEGLLHQVSSHQPLPPPFPPHPIPPCHVPPQQLLPYQLPPHQQPSYQPLFDSIGAGGYKTRACKNYTSMVCANTHMILI